MEDEEYENLDWVGAMDTTTGEWSDADPFEVGDRVRLVRGQTPLVVIEVMRTSSSNRPMIKAKYKHHRHWLYADRIPWRQASDFVHYEESNEKEKSMTYINTELYETKDGKFGTLLARNSTGQLVLEIKGTGEVIAVDPAEATVVRPYTVKLKSLLERSNGYHAETVPGSVEVGDVILRDNGTLWTVTVLDTKAEANSVLRGRKLLTESIGVPEPK